MMDAASRFFQLLVGALPQAGVLQDVCLSVCDSDTRRWLQLKIVDMDADAVYQSPETWVVIYTALAAMIDGRQASNAITSVVMTADGTIVSTSWDESNDITPGTFYAPPADYQLARPAVPTIRRDHLVELRRLGPFADLVAPLSSPSEQLVFKHYETHLFLTDVWCSIHIMAGLRDHAHIVPIQHLVTHEDCGGVVGFTMPFLPGGTLQDTLASRPFKLKWAKQLFQTLDDLNLQHGIDHRDIRLRNLIVDPATDNLVIIDLGSARSRGRVGTTCVPPAALQPRESQGPLSWLAFLPPSSSEEEEKARARHIKMETDEDVNAAIATLHGLVTRDPTDWSWEGESGLWRGRGIDDITAAPWTAHPDVRLDSPAEAYRAALNDWLKQRRADPRYPNGPSTPLDFPRHMPIPRGDTVHVQGYQPPIATNGDEELADQAVVSGYNFFRRDAVRAGRAVVEWARPLASDVDPARTLLANGQYADDGAKQ
ncbi:hypothetical protein QBC34DRAFT_412017 [Podospora aff. communis PSN243]|uniref:EKC/KEOPS complex subunit BUD32 n=1 Tax=Podospora aff. communis PSN243 TaxID=3040156 RepID=A0AAV9GFI3_9PEZI|nr:hypothetical protein QBC34DRAFT_412017 [Podospora aff. communis PSN243]